MSYMLIQGPALLPAPTNLGGTLHRRASLRHRAIPHLQLRTGLILVKMMWRGNLKKIHKGLPHRAAATPDASPDHLCVCHGNVISA